jgi:hypothetical protein
MPVGIDGVSDASAVLADGRVLNDLLRLAEN